MRTSRRLATLTLAAAAGLTLAACSSTVHASGKPAPTTQETTASDSPAPTTEQAGDSADTVPSADGEHLPEPGAGVPGDAGLCQAVVGWFGYVSLSLLAADDNGRVDPADVVPLLQAMRDAPAAHRDADGDLLAAAADVSDAADGAIGELQSGGDLYTAISGLERPVTDFATACQNAGITL